MRTDRNNNPTAFSTDLARQAGLVLGVDYVAGDPFPSPSTLVTAKILGDPVAVSIKLIDAVGYYTRANELRWTYIAIPDFDWKEKTFDQKRDIIGYHYMREGGTAMIHLFPRYGQK